MGITGRKDTWERHLAMPESGDSGNDISLPDHAHLKGRGHPGGGRVFLNGHTRPPLPPPRLPFSHVHTWLQFRLHAALLTASCMRDLIRETVPPPTWGPSSCRRPAIGLLPRVFLAAAGRPPPKFDSAYRSVLVVLQPLSLASGAVNPNWGVTRGGGRAHESGRLRRGHPTGWYGYTGDASLWPPLPGCPVGV